MSPIPANASAAMIVSFFVAVMVTPWLMMVFGASHHAPAGAGHAEGGRLGALYSIMARPILASQRRAWLFLVLVGLTTLGSLGLFYTQHVTVKLLPFDDKPELSVQLDLPRGTAVEETDRVLQQIVDALRPVAEVASLQSHAGTAAPFNFNGLVRHAYLRADPHMGDVQVNLHSHAARTRPSHTIALEIRERLAKANLPAGARVKVVEPPPGPPVLATLLAEIYGPDAETRRQVAGKLRETFASIPFIVDIDDSFGSAVARRRLAIADDQLELFKVEQRDVYETIRLYFGGQVVGYSHRGGGRQPIPIRLGSARRRWCWTNGLSPFPCQPTCCPVIVRWSSWAM